MAPLLHRAAIMKKNKKKKNVSKEVLLFQKPQRYRARQLYKNISMLFLFPVKRDLLFTNI